MTARGKWTPHHFHSHIRVSFFASSLELISKGGSWEGAEVDHACLVSQLFPEASNTWVLVGNSSACNSSCAMDVILTLSLTGVGQLRKCYTCHPNFQGEKNVSITRHSIVFQYFLKEGKRGRVERQGCPWTLLSKFWPAQHCHKAPKIHFSLVQGRRKQFYRSPKDMLDLTDK